MEIFARPISRGGISLYIIKQICIICTPIKGRTICTLTKWEGRRGSGRRVVVRILSRRGVVSVAGNFCGVLVVCFVVRVVPTGSLSRRRRVTAVGRYRTRGAVGLNSAPMATRVVVCGGGLRCRRVHVIVVRRRLVDFRRALLLGWLGCLALRTGL